MYKTPSGRGFCYTKYTVFGPMAGLTWFKFRILCRPLFPGVSGSRLTGLYAAGTPASPGLKSRPSGNDPSRGKPRQRRRHPCIVHIHIFLFERVQTCVALIPAIRGISATRVHFERGLSTLMP